MTKNIQLIIKQWKQQQQNIKLSKKRKTQSDN